MSSSTVSSPAVAPSPRLLALDVLRGITIAAMLLVNTPGSWDHVYPALEHAEWNGLHVADFVFPFFLFMTGVAMIFSLRKFAGQPKKTAACAIVRRAVLLVVIGVLVHAFPFFNPPPTEWRFPGVLQRIGICYGAVGLMSLWLPPRALFGVGVALLLGYWAVLTGWGGPAPYALDGNLAGRIDVFVFGLRHLWDKDHAFDPEGLLSTLPAIATTLQGFWAGRILQRAVPLPARIIRLALTGAAMIVLGLVWSPWMPINKALWTSSYVLATGGAAFAALGLLLWMLDVRGVKTWAVPFQAFGTNALFAYCMGELWILILVRLVQFTDARGQATDGYDWLYDHIFAPLAGPLNGSLLFALAHVCAFGAVLWILFKRKIVIKI